MAALAAADLPVVPTPGALLGAGSDMARWLATAEGGSGVEAALYRSMPLPGGEVLFRRAPSESRPLLSQLLSQNQKSAALYSLRALQAEQALDFTSAEADWKTWAAQADDKAAAALDLANYYSRRLQPEAELSALRAASQLPASDEQRLTPPTEQPAWRAFERSLQVLQRDALPRTRAREIYAVWEQRYPGEADVYRRELGYLSEDGSAADVEALLARYRKAFPTDKVFPVKAQAEVAARRGSAEDGLAVYARNFEPLWPAELVGDYYQLLVQSRQLRKTTDALRARIAKDPNDLRDVACLFRLLEQQGQLDGAKATIADYRDRKAATGAAWNADELFTLGQLLESAQDFSEAARYDYALASQSSADAREKGMAGLIRILLTAPEQPLRAGDGNLALYSNVATMDRGPGYFNGVLSLLFNSESPRSELAQQEVLAGPYFRRSRAAALLADFDAKYPGSAQRPDLHSRLLNAYAAYGENEAILHEGEAYLAAFAKGEQRVDIALEVADAYSRIGQQDKEFDVYQRLLQELSEQAKGMPLGPNRVSTGGQAVEDAASATQKPVPAPAKSVSSHYAQVLDRYVSRLVSLNRLPDAVAVLRAQIDRNPQDPGLYDRLAQFLEQNSLAEKQEAVYQRAIQQFQDRGWYARLARLYLRQKRSSDYSALSRKVTAIFSGTDLEAYIREAPAPDRSLALEVNRYAHQRFPHDLVFINNLLAAYARAHQDAEREKLLWEHWAESPALRDQLFELLSRTQRLSTTLATLKQQSPQVGKGEWQGLAASNPAAERFWLEAALWGSQYEEGVAPAAALSEEYPADRAMGEQASSLYRSLAYFHPEDTDRAVAIEKRLLTYRPADLDTLARIGDIYADRDRYAEAAPYWMRMGAVHPGEGDGYLQAATVFWDYYDFSSAFEQITAARKRLSKPSLYGFEAGAIEESRNNRQAALGEYVRAALNEDAVSESRERLLALARSSDTRSAVDAATADLLRGKAPTPAAIQLRVSILDAQNRRADLARELANAARQSDSFEVLEALAEAARNHTLPEAEETALRREAALATDSSRQLQLRYQAINLLEKRDRPAASAEIDALYRQHSKILGVVRATVDYDWEHEEKARAVDVLLGAAQGAYPELASRLQLEAASKLTDMAEYGRARGLLDVLMRQEPANASYQSALAATLSRSGDAPALASFYQSQLVQVKASALPPTEKQQRIAELRRGMIRASTLLGKPADAVDQYIELINSYPEDAGLIAEAATYAQQQGRRQQLVGFYEKTIVNAPRDPRWTIVLAHLQTSFEDFPAAIAAYTAALRLRPERTDLYQARVALEERLHQSEPAIADYEKLYTLTYRDPRWMEKLAETRARQGRGADAVKALETAWIAGRTVKAGNFFEVAQRLERWGLIEEARHFAEQGADQAGAELLADANLQSGVKTYARVLARQRQTEQAVARLSSLRQKAGEVTLLQIEQHALQPGEPALSADEWRKQKSKERTRQATAAFAAALSAAGEVVATYGTPEEKADFAALLKKTAAGAGSAEIRAIYLPATHSAGLADVEATLRWQLIESSPKDRAGELAAWRELQEQRLLLSSSGSRMEQLAATVPLKQRAQLFNWAAQAYRKAGDTKGELRALRLLAERTPLAGENQQRYFKLQLAADPSTLVRQATSDPVTQYLVEQATPLQAQTAISTRGAKLQPVWQNAYGALTGLYRRQQNAQVNGYFQSALADGVNIGQRMDHRTDRAAQIAGSPWFYYGARYGEYLDAGKDAHAEDYFDSELEGSPESSDAYVHVGDYALDSGRIEQAIVDYRTALELKPAQPAVLNQLAEAHWKQGRHAEAAAQWQEAIKVLGAQAESARVPETYWPDFDRVIRSIAAHGQFAAVHEQVDGVVRATLRSTGSWRADSVLEPAYRANGNSVDWLLAMTAHADLEQQILSAIAGSPWLVRDQRSQVLGRLVQLERQSPTAAESVPAHQLRWVQALLAEKKTAEARRAVEALPASVRQSSEWIIADLRIADAEGKLQARIAEWQHAPEKAGDAATLRRAASYLGADERARLLRFVYQRDLDQQNFVSSSFLGLAALELDAGNTAAATQILRRLTLVGPDQSADTEAAARLLESRRRHAEAIPFLRELVESAPWQADYKIRLATALHAADARSEEALQLASAIVADPQSDYAARAQAASLLKGHGTAPIGSGELRLLALSKCPAAATASLPYFVQARVAAAACLPSAMAREQLLRDAMAVAPGDEKVRLAYVWSAFAAGADATALTAAQPYLVVASAQIRYGEQEADLDAPAEASPEATPTDRGMTREEHSRLLRLAISAHIKAGDLEAALGLLESALVQAQDTQQRQALTVTRKRLRDRIARASENAARAPRIHEDLDQDRIVRARLLANEPLPTSGAPRAEDQE